MAKIEIDQEEILKLLDHVNELVTFASVAMPSVNRYNVGSKAFWAVVHRIAGHDKMARKLERKLADDVMEWQKECEKKIAERGW